MALVGTNALTTLADVKTALSISGSTQDALLEALILTASEAIEKYCSRSFKQVVGKTEKLEGWGTPTLFPSLTPISALTSITYEGSPGVSYDVTRMLFDRSFIEWLDGRFPHTAFLQEGTIDPVLQAGTERRLITVVYTGGYVLPNDPSPTCPPGLQLACTRLAAHLFRSIARDESVAAESVGDAALQFVTSVDVSTSLPVTVRMLLAGYKRAV